MGEGDYVLSEWQKAGLLKPSVVKAVLATVEKTLILRRLGKVTASDMRRIDQGLAKALGLST